MSVYTSTAPMLSQQDSPHQTTFIPQYPQLPQSGDSARQAPQAYMNVDPQLDGGGGSNRADSQSQTQTPSRPKKAEIPSASRPRLRKACDSCSIRKVRCDESGPPCKACIGLEIPCTFNRQSKRRGPPNRHAEHLKRERFDPDGGSGLSQPSSPTHAAQTLAAFAQQQVLSAESICPLPVLESLVDDYFIYIHPLVPLPHKPTFYNRFRTREDMNDPNFLALLASMVGCLAASFPRRPRQHFRAHGMEYAFPNSLSFVGRCHTVAMQAQGPGYLDTHLTLDDVMISYLQGLTSSYTCNQHSTILYYRQCLSILTTLGIHEDVYAKPKPVIAPQARMMPNGHALEAPLSDGVDYIVRELSRRTFWLLFRSIRSLHQVGVSPWQLPLLPATSLPYPDLPLEIDDEYITPNQIIQQPSDVISELTGFNANTKIFTTYNDLATLELVHGVDKVTDWQRQKQVIGQSLLAIKGALEGLPTELNFKTKHTYSRPVGEKYPPPPTNVSALQEMGHYAANGYDSRHDDYNRIHELRRVQYDIQKTHIYANQLGTRLYLVEKYRKLDAANQKDATTSSLDEAAQVQDKDGHTNDDRGMTERDMAEEEKEITNDFPLILSSLAQATTEPSGIGFISQLRQICLTLLDQSGTGKSSITPRLEAYLRHSSVILTKLERIAEPGDTFGDEENAQARLWAEMKECQDLHKVVTLQNGDGNGNAAGHL